MASSDGASSSSSGGGHPGALAHARDRALTWLSRWLGPWTALVLTAALGLAIVAPLVAAFTEIWEGLRTVTDGAQFDDPVHAWATTIRQPWATTIAVGATLLAGRVGMPILTLVLAAALSLRSRSTRPLVLLVITGVGSLVFTSVAKTLAGRDRPPASGMLPPIETSPSFPSGHTLNSTAVMLVVAYCAWLVVDRLAVRLAAIAACVALPVVVGFSRIYLGQHWFTDVVAAFALGAAWAGTVIIGHRLFLAVRERRRALPAEAIETPAP